MYFRLMVLLFLASGIAFSKNSYSSEPAIVYPIQCLAIQGSPEPPSLNYEFYIKPGTCVDVDDSEVKEFSFYPLTAKCEFIGHVYRTAGGNSQTQKPLMFCIDSSAGIFAKDKYVPMFDFAAEQKRNYQTVIQMTQEAEQNKIALLESMKPKVRYVKVKKKWYKRAGKELKRVYRQGEKNVRRAEKDTRKEIKRPFEEIKRFFCVLDTFEHMHADNKEEDTNGDGINDEWKECYDNSEVSIGVGFGGDRSVQNVTLSTGRSGEISYNLNQKESAEFKSSYAAMEKFQKEINSSYDEDFENFDYFTDAFSQELFSTIRKETSHKSPIDTNFENSVLSLASDSSSLSNQALLERKLEIKKAHLKTQELLYTEFIKADAGVKAFTPWIIGLSAVDMGLGIVRDMTGTKVIEDAATASSKASIGLLRSFQMAKTVAGAQTNEDLMVGVIEHYFEFSFIPDTVSTTYVFVTLADDTIEYIEHARDIDTVMTGQIKSLKKEIEEMEQTVIKNRISVPN